MFCFNNFFGVGFVMPIRVRPGIGLIYFTTIALFLLPLTLVRGFLIRQHECNFERSCWRGDIQRQLSSLGTRTRECRELPGLVKMCASHNHHKPQIKKKNADLSSCSVETSLQKVKGFQYILGSDEAGRGAIAGPLVAASCCLLLPNLSEAISSGAFSPIEGVKDSKLLTYEECLAIYNSLNERTDQYAWRTTVVNASDIDDMNVQVANMAAIRGSIEGIVKDNDLLPERLYSIVDGKKSPKLSPELNGVLRSRPWVRADTEVYTVALASIIARVVRDKIILEQAHFEYPQYRFNENGGYPSQAHLQYIHKHGPCPWHRQSVKPIQQRHGTLKSNNSSD